jgi:hypothetical protein
VPAKNTPGICHVIRGFEFGFATDPVAVFCRRNLRDRVELHTERYTPMAGLAGAKYEVHLYYCGSAQGRAAALSRGAPVCKTINLIASLGFVFMPAGFKNGLFKLLGSF